MSQAKSISRRKFLQYGGVVTGAAATLGLAGVSMAAEAEEKAAAAPAAQPATPPLYRGRMYFTNNLEFSILSGAAERIFPKDETGPGAVELAVPYFIDNQLAGAYGYNAREYTHGPFFPGAPTQGPQSPLLRRDVIKQGLYAMNNAAQERFQKNFPDLGAEQQDQILADCESGKLATQGGYTSSYFFALLRDMVLGGAYADPLYNGNNDMNGWRMKEYPGAQMAYSYLMTSDAFEKIPPISLSSMQ